jgi:hypothetical protein
MRVSSAAILLCFTGTITVGSAGLAAAQSCDQLWYQRNSIYKSAGYCFKTQRAISAFGNAGCMYDSENAVPLSPSDRAQIASIVRMEQEFGCR